MQFITLLILLSGLTTAAYAAEQEAATTFSCPENSYQTGSAPPEGLERQCLLADGRRHGPYQHWYENGQIMESLNFKNGLEHGEQQAWWPNGKRLMQGVSINGKRYQGYKYWTINGKRREMKFKTIEEKL